MNFDEYIREIKDFPQPGVQYKDITTLLQDGAAYKGAIEELKQRVSHLRIDKVAGPEARGFVIGAPLAYALGVGFVPIRKSGKLPAETIEASYDLEYGQDKLAVHKDAVRPGERVLIADDLLATGGTVTTAMNLIRQLQGEVVGLAFLIELTYLAGRDKLKDMDIITLVQY